MEAYVRRRAIAIAARATSLFRDMGYLLIKGNYDS